MEKNAADQNRTGGGLMAVAPWMARRSFRFSVYGARFDERKRPGDRGGSGELTGPKSNEREAVDAARRSTDGDGFPKIAAALM